MHKKFGTVLYHRGDDSLSWALSSSSANRETTYNLDDADNQPTTNEAIVTKAACNLNNLLHEENKQLPASNAMWTNIYRL